MMHDKSICLSHNEGTQQEEKKTCVLWDIIGCPIPDGYDPRLVGGRIESALNNSGYSGPGPLTITAIGDLGKTPGDKVLRELASTGIALIHCHDIEWALWDWNLRNRSPGTMMLISAPSQLQLFAPTLHYLEKQEYKILVAYPQRRDPVFPCESNLLGVVSKEWLWRSLLEGEMDSSDNKLTRLVLPDFCPETDKSPWSCLECSFAAQSVEDLTTHLKSLKHAYSEWDRLASKQGVTRFNVKPPPPNDDPDTIKEWDLLYEADIEWRLKISSEETRRKYEIMKQHNKKDNQTLVLWDINSCPIPNGYDSSLVRPRIECAVKNSGFYGLVTIVAIGNLTETPGDKVLRELSSTGIALKHSHKVEADLYEWTRRNPYPATIMLISGPSQLVDFSPALHNLHFEGYTILVAYSQRDPVPGWLWKSFQRIVQEEWLWKSLLEGEMDSGSADKTTRLVLQDKCSETGESPWSCSVCDFAGQSFEDFTAHLNMHIMQTPIRRARPKKKKLMKKRIMNPVCIYEEELEKRFRVGTMNKS